jgi:uncharacterized SAM-binding protein YcdF (DUF218 family)
MARRVKKTWWSFANLVLMLIFSTGVWGLGLFRFADEIPTTVADAETQTDAIVVLTGGSGRLAEGLGLLAAGRADRMFISGVYYGLDVRTLLKVMQSSRRLESQIAIGNATNTVGNARETAEWVNGTAKDGGGIDSIRLVTAAYHMPRSLLEFHAAMTEVKVIPHPVFPAHVKADWWAWPGTAVLVLGEYNKFLSAWLRQHILPLFEKIG